MLPTHDAAQTVEYGNNPDVEIAAQTADLHVVVEKTQNAIAANAFSVEPQTSAYVETVGELSVLMVREGGVAKVWVSQPTRSNEPVKVKFPQAAGETLQDDKDNRVEWVDGYWQIKTDGLNGAPYHFTYTL